MISPAQPLSFDCEFNDLGFCQSVDINSLPKYQFPLYCDTELTGGLQKLPCEELVVISNLSDVFDDIVGMSVSNNKITPFGSQPHYASKSGYFEHNKFYLISIQIVNMTQGEYYVTCGDTVSDPITTNGIFSQVMWSGTSGTSFVISGLDGDLDLDGYVANVVVQCLRYSELYTIAFDTSNPPIFITPTCIQAVVGSRGLSFSEEIPSIVPGKTYKLSFKISENTCNAPDTEFSYGLGYPAGPLTVHQIANGFFEIDVVAGDNPTKLLQLSMPTCFDGKIQDITLYEKNEIGMAIYDQDKNLASPTVLVEEVDGKYLATIQNAVPGCFKVGYADLCSNYYKQFTGENIIELAQSRELVNVFLELGEYLFTIGNSAYVIYRNFLVPGIVFDLVVSGVILTDDATDFDIEVTAGGTVMTLISTSPAPSPDYVSGTEYTFTYQGVAGSSNRDLILKIDVSGTTSVFGQINLGEIYLNVAQQDGNFIPEFYSECLSFVDGVPDCSNPNQPMIEIQWSNERTVFGLDFDVTGYGNARMWIPGKFWHPTYSKERDIYKKTSGNRRINYSDTDEKFTLTTGYMPGYMIKALVLAVDCDTFLINGVAYVCTSEEAQPEWNNNTTLGTVELEFVKQDTSYLKSFS